MSLDIPIVKEKASGKKYNKRGLKVTKKVSPKSDRQKPELKLLFEKIRQKKERDAERKKNLNSIKDDDKETSERKKVLVRKEESIESVSDILMGGHSVVPKLSNFGASPLKISQGDGKVRKLVNNMEKKIEECGIKRNKDKPKNKNVDILKISSSPISKKKSVSPLRHRKISRQKSEKIIAGVSEKNLTVGSNSI